MDVLMLSRLQFAATTIFHFFFVPLTLGLSLLLAVMETKYAKTGDEIYLRMTKFWGKLFLINFAVGVVTGLTLEFQFGTNWSRYSAYVGDIFGSLLAIEATMAFFLESVFIGIWIFGWKKLSRKAHAAVMWCVAIGSNVSALWILIANSWMQRPVGYTIRDGRAELTDFTAVITNEFALIQIFHVLAAALVVASFFVMGISAYHLIRKQHVAFFTRSFRFALVSGLIFSLTVAINGDLNGAVIAKYQPAKLAAMEAQWETRTQAPFHILTWPDEENEKNLIESLSIPGGLSLLAYKDINAEVKGLKEWPKEDRPPVLFTFLGFRLMVALGALFPLLCIIGWIYRKKLLDKTWYLKAMFYAIPLPYIACSTGWIMAEVGRQPWLVQDLMRASDGVSPVSAMQVGISLGAFILLYGLLGLTGFLLMAKHARKGPAPISEETEMSDTAATADAVA
jgi:cytochrome bd ubiquinol oxidase subunit I